MANNPDLYYKKHISEVEKIGAAHQKQSEFKKKELDSQREHLEEAYKAVAYQDMINRKNIRWILQPKDRKMRKERFKEAVRLKLIDGESVSFKLVDSHRHKFYAE